jgi:NAD(P)H-dependent flavin oxidoreductase YrpB (nitropropane dioxygenase family)
MRSMNDGVNHLGAGPTTPGIEPDREFFPAGQGVGAIHELTPAAEIVHRMVDEAEHIIARLGDLRRSETGLRRSETGLRRSETGLRR